MADETSDSPGNRDAVPRRPPVASNPPEITKRRAVVAGIGPYARNPLVNAPRDAQAVADLLERDYGFSVRLLLDSEATLDTLRQAVRASLDEADEATQWIFYFAGHGLSRHGKGYLLPVDGSAKDLETCLSVSALRDQCLGSRCGEALLILDACHAGQALVRDRDLDERMGPGEEEENSRIRQILCAGNPFHSVVDDGGEGHSVFTRCLLEALEGWAGVHEEDGSLHFRPLLKYLQTEVERRLEEVPPESRQKVIGGFLIGNAQGREAVFRVKEDVPRIHPQTIQELRSGEPEARLKGLEKLAREGAGSLATLPLAVRLAAQHAQSIQGHRDAERAAAVRTLGRLGQSLGDKRLPEEEALLQRILMDAALFDRSPAVRHQARWGLVRMHPETQRVAADELLAHLAARFPGVRRHAWQAVAALPPARRRLPLYRRLRVPFTRSRQETAALGRAAVATKMRKRAWIASWAFVFLVYAGLASSYYVSTFNQTNVVVRAGHPGLKFLPGVGKPLVVTDYTAQSLNDRTLAQEERLTGSWLHLRNGAFSWGDQLFEHLPPAEAGLAWWRMGDSERAFARLKAGVEAGDIRSLEMLGYLGLQPEAAVAPAVNLLAGALETKNPLQRQTAIAALGRIRHLRPQEVDGLLTERLGGASSPEAASIVLAIEGLGKAGERGPGPRREPPRETDLDAILKATWDGNSLVRETAVIDLLEAAFGSAEGARRALPVFRLLISDPLPGVRREAAIGLLMLDGGGQDEASVAFAEVVRALGSEDPLEARNMRNALAEIFPRAALPARFRLARRLAGHAATLEAAEALPILDLLTQPEGRHPELLADLVALLTAVLAETGREGDVAFMALNRLAPLRQRPPDRLEPVLALLYGSLDSAQPEERAAAAEAAGILASGHPRLASRAMTRLRRLLADPVPHVQAAAVRGLAWIGAEQAGTVSDLLSPLLAAMASPAPAVRSACAEALGRLRPVPALFSRVAPVLLTAIRDPAPSVRQGAAEALAAWGRAASGRGPEIVPVREQLARETDPEARGRLAAAFAVLGRGDPETVRQVTRLAETGFASALVEERLRAVWLLRHLAGPEAGSEAVAALRTPLRDPEPEVRRQTLVVLFLVGAAGEQDAVTVADLVGPLLLDPGWPSRLDALANNLGPLTREQPAVVARTVLWLRKLLVSETLLSENHLIGSTAAGILCEALTALARTEPEAPWPLLASGSSFERSVGRKILARLVAERPERAPGILSRLGRYRRSLHPHVRISAAQAEEMIFLLQKTEESLGKPDAAFRWREILESLASMDVKDAVSLSLDKLEPGTQHG